MMRTAKRALAVSVALIGIFGGGVGTAAARTPDDGAGAAGRDRPTRVVAPVTFEPMGTHEARGVARLSAAPGGRAGIIAILISLTAHPAGPSDPVYRFAGGAVPCDQLPADASRLRRLEPPLEVSDGTAIVTEGVWDDTDIVHLLKKARSLSIVGDFDGDGRDDIGACGDLRPLRVVNNPRVADGLLFGSSPCAACGEGKLLGNLLTLRADEDLRGAAALTGLAPETGHVAGVSDESCDAAGGSPALRPAGHFTTDPLGVAVTDLVIDPFDASARSIVVAETDPPLVVGCRDLTVLPVAVR